MSQSNTFSNHDLRNLPSVIEHKLSWIKRRQIALTLAQGIAIGLGVLFAGLIVAMAIDWIFVLFSPAKRTLLTTATLVTAIATALVALIGPLRRVWSVQHAARVVDDNVPALQQRWTTVTSLKLSPKEPLAEEQRMMQEQVTSEAVAMQSLVKPSELAPLSSIRHPMVVLACCTIALAGFMAIYPQQTRVLWNRFWSPTHDITATKLLDKTNVQMLPRGESIDLTVLQQGVPRSDALLSIKYPSGQMESWDIAADETDKEHFVHTMRVDESFSLSDARRRWTNAMARSPGH